MRIRVMTICDYEQVYNLWLSCKGMGFNDTDDSKEGISITPRFTPIFAVVE